MMGDKKLGGWSGLLWKSWEIGESGIRINKS